MSKTLLVAKREYLENLRTKTFWIGILTLPVLLVVVTVVSAAMQRTKDVRRYAVLDQSGWLLEAVEERAEYDDKLRLLRFLQDKAGDGEDAVAALPEALRAAARQVASLDEEGLVALARLSAAQEKALLGDRAPAEAAASLSQELKAQGRQVAEWFTTLTPGEARRLLPRLDRARYERVEVPADEPDAEAWARAQLEARDGLFAYFVIGEDPVAGSEGSKYVSNNRTDPQLRSWFAGLATDLVRERRFDVEGVDPESALRIQERFEFEERKLAEGGEAAVKEQDIVRQAAPGVFTYLLWIAVFSIANMLLTNTIEEKSNRLIEVLLSSVSPTQLMVGKTLGIAATGLTMVGSWVIFFLIALKTLPALVRMPEGLDLTLLLRDPVFLGSFVFYFLTGYLLYAAVLVGLGSVCNSLKEAQNFMGPIMILLILPLLALVPIAQDPNGTLAKVMSWIPPFTPLVMMNRAAGPPAAWEYAGTTVVLFLAIAAAFWMSGRIFRIGILMTGKPPSVLQMLRWLRNPAGALPDTQPGSPGGGGEAEGG